MNVIHPIDISREIPSVLSVLQQPLLTVVLPPDLILTEPESEGCSERLTITLQPPLEADLLKLRLTSEAHYSGNGSHRMEDHSQSSQQEHCQCSVLTISGAWSQLNSPAPTS